MCYGNGAKLHVETINEMGGERGFINISNLACNNQATVNCDTNWGCNNIVCASDGDTCSLIIPKSSKPCTPTGKTTEDEN